jgi:alkyl hydroperoxide reductase subunit D
VMNKVFHGFVHLVEEADYQTLPARLRMTAMARPGVDKVDFELWSLVGSAVNGCGMCLESPEKTVRRHGLSPEQVQAAVRIAATVLRCADASGQKRWLRRWRRLPG